MVNSPGLPTVLLTGAGGKIGSGFRRRYLQAYSDAYSLRLGVHRGDFSDEHFQDISVIDIEDRGTLDRACAGADTVVHLAANPDWRADFRDGLLGPNIVGAYNVFEAALAAGCRRVVYASSVHAIMGYPVDFQSHDDDPSRPDTLYGVTKVFGEALCSSYAHVHGISCIALRIGAYVADDERDRVVRSDNPQLLDIVISERDMAELLHKAITAPGDVKFAVVAGISNNRFKRMSIDGARKLLGYDPQDDAFEWSSEVDFGVERKV